MNAFSMRCRLRIRMTQCNVHLLLLSLARYVCMFQITDVPQFSFIALHSVHDPLILYIDHVTPLSTPTYNMLHNILNGKNPFRLRLPV
jgi:hypothetical protein